LDLRWLQVSPGDSAEVWTFVFADPMEWEAFFERTIPRTGLADVAEAWPHLMQCGVTAHCRPEYRFEACVTPAHEGRANRRNNRPFGGAMVTQRLVPCTEGSRIEFVQAAGDNSGLCCKTQPGEGLGQQTCTPPAPRLAIVNCGGSPSGDSPPAAGQNPPLNKNAPPAMVPASAWPTTPVSV
jgi:hypothetical protein